MTCFVQRAADRADAPVHHVARRDQIGARRGIRDRRAGEEGKRAVVVDLVPVQDSAVAVVGVLAETDVRPEK